MCGRFTLTAPADELVEVFGTPAPPFALGPRYNVAPGQDALVVGQDRHGRRMGRLRWGFVPEGSPLTGSGYVNARAETAARTPSFRRAFAARRCLVPADGFYEWRSAAGGKEPFLFRPAGGGVLALAAIWEHWEAPEHTPRDAFAILTVDAGPDVSPIHHRMPAIVAPEDFDTWLDRSTPPATAAALLHPSAEGTLRGHPVSTRVNSAREDDPGLVEPIGPAG